MRVGVISWSRRSVGGLETFVERLLAELHDRGHEVGLWTEMDLPANRPRIELPPGTFSWSVAELGLERALAELRAWRPDVTSTHGLVDPRIERSTFAIAPATFFAHAYSGTCISGVKAFSFPEPRPCHRTFGWKCLLQYYPRRCGGLDPITMLREYDRQRQRLAVMRCYRRLFTRSAHMRDEYVRHGFPRDLIRMVDHELDGGEGTGAPDVDGPARQLPGAGHPLRLLFLGRMDRLKGGRVLLDALPALARPGRPVRLVFAGDGPDRAHWERQARRLMDRTPGVEVVFTGWIDRARRTALLQDSDLLLVPSLWPEPFGLVGREAGLHGVPSVGFAVGGIPDWLVEGDNGCLAPGDPATAAGLAAAVARAIDDPATYARLSRGAALRARSYAARRGPKIVADALEELAHEDDEHDRAGAPVPAEVQ